MDINKLIGILLGVAEGPSSTKDLLVQKNIVEKEKSLLLSVNHKIIIKQNGSAMTNIPMELLLEIRENITALKINFSFF